MDKDSGVAKLGCTNMPLQQDTEKQPPSFDIVSDLTLVDPFQPTSVPRQVAVPCRKVGRVVIVADHTHRFFLQMHLVLRISPAALVYLRELQR